MSTVPSIASTTSFILWKSHPIRTSYLIVLLIRSTWGFSLESPFSVRLILFQLQVKRKIIFTTLKWTSQDWYIYCSRIEFLCPSDGILIFVCIRKIYKADCKEEFLSILKQLQPRLFHHRAVFRKRSVSNSREVSRQFYWLLPSMDWNQLTESILLEGCYVWKLHVQCFPTCALTGITECLLSTSRFGFIERCVCESRVYWIRVILE